MTQDVSFRYDEKTFNISKNRRSILRRYWIPNSNPPTPQPYRFRFAFLYYFISNFPYIHTSDGQGAPGTNYSRPVGLEVRRLHHSFFPFPFSFFVSKNVLGKRKKRECQNLHTDEQGCHEAELAHPAHT